MSKVNLSDTNSGYNLSTINANFEAVEEEFNDKVLYRDNPTGEPNEMNNLLDMNGNRIINLPAPQNGSEPVRLMDIPANLVIDISSALNTTYDPTLPITATNVQGALDQLAVIEATQTSNIQGLMITSLPYVPTMADLRLTNETTFPGLACILGGYFNQGDQGGGEFFKDLTDVTSADNGGSIIVNASGRRIKRLNNVHFYPEMFGARGNGGTNDAPAINAAIAALPDRGGTVEMLGKTYAIAAGIVIGNGNNGSTASTKTGVKLIGQGGGDSFFSQTPTILQVIDGGQASPYIDTVVVVNGAIECKLMDFKIFTRGINSPLANNGVLLQGVCGSRFENVNVTGQKNIGWWIQAGAAPTGNYNIGNKFSRCMAFSNINGNVGLLMDGVAAVSNDTWLTSFEDCRWDTMNASNCQAAQLKFMDSCTFTRCHMVADNVGGVTVGSNVTGCYFNAVGNNGFPSGVGFYDCSIINTFVNESGSDKIRPNSFYNHGTADNEAIPTHPMLRGITDTFAKFNWS